MGKNLYIFFTDSINTDDEKYLSYKAKKFLCKKDNSKIECFYKYFNNSENHILIFVQLSGLRKAYPSLLHKENDVVKIVFNSLPEEIEKEKDKIENLFLFFHGGDFKGYQTFWSYEEEFEIQLEADKEVKTFYFTHSNEDLAYILLIDYKSLALLQDLELNVFIDKIITCNEVYNYIKENLISSTDFIDSLNNFEKEFFEDKIKTNIIQITKNETFKYLWVKIGKKYKNILLKNICFTPFIYFLERKMKEINKNLLSPAIIQIEDFDITNEKETKHLDKRINFLDSSIWIRIAKNEEEKEQIENEFKWFAKAEVYKSAIGQEFIDLLFKQVKIEPLATGAHSGKVNPFHFHSETKMKQELQQLIEILKNYKWDFLFIDDFGHTGLRIYNKNDNFGNTSKSEIIQNIINGKFCSENQNSFDIIENFHIAQTIKQEYIKKEANNTQESKKIKNAINSLKSKTYDIILLDYLFSNENIFEKGHIHYGLELFEILNKNYSELKKGIKDKFWIFPVSVFNQAFLSKFNEKGFEYITTKWYFSPGADPINTPYLFRNKLLKFLKLQLEHLPNQVGDLFEIFTDFSELKADKNLSDTTLKLWSSKLLITFLEKFGYIFLLPEKQDKSAFLKTIYEKNDIKRENFDRSFYQIASTIRDFLNYCYNQEFNRDRLLKTFIELNQIWLKVRDQCEVKDKNKIDRFFIHFKNFLNL